MDLKPGKKCVSLAPGPWHSQRGFLHLHGGNLNQGEGVGPWGSHEVKQPSAAGPGQSPKSVQAGEVS